MEASIAEAHFVCVSCVSPHTASRSLLPSISVLCILSHGVAEAHFPPSLSSVPPLTALALSPALEVGTTMELTVVWGSILPDPAGLVGESRAEPKPLTLQPLCCKCSHCLQGAPAPSLPGDFETQPNTSHKNSTEALFLEKPQSQVLSTLHWFDSKSA